MGKSNDTESRTTDQLVHLTEQRNKLGEGTPAFLKLQAFIDKIIAQRFLEYTNR